jgi:hypothetical protein
VAHDTRRYREAGTDLNARDSRESASGGRRL